MKFVFDKADIMISFKIVGQTGIVFLCSASSSESSSGSGQSTATATACTSISGNPVPAGTYTVEVSSGDSNAAGFTPWTAPPLLKTYYVGDTDYCKPSA